MAELLVLAADRGRYKRGMVVQVAPDGAAWARRESRAQWIAEGFPARAWPGVFVIVKLPGVPLERARALRHRVPDESVSRNDAPRDVRLDLDALPAPRRAELDRDGAAELDAGERAAMVVRDARDGRVRDDVLTDAD